jgi:ornithine decarboxylase
MADVEPIAPLFDPTHHGLIKKSASFIVKSASLNPKPALLKPWNQPIGNCSVEDIMKHRVTELAARDIECQDAFYVADLGEIARQHLQFRTLLPRVEPFYGT